jgi:SRSO17 transposase
LYASHLLSGRPCPVLSGAISGDRERPLRDHCTGLVTPCERKSVKPMAAVTAPARVGAQHQSLLHFVGEAPWSDENVSAKVREMVLPAIERHGPIEALIIDGTGFPKQRRHSVRVSRQYCGQLGKQDNCQVAVSLPLANHDASLHRPISVKALARGLPPRAWRAIQWRKARPCRCPRGLLACGFASPIEYWLAEPRAEEWLLIEWPQGENEPTKCWLSTLPGDITFRRLVDIAKLRWRIERDYHEFKQEVGLGHFEGRGWCGFHHHATLCIAACGSLISEWGRFPLGTSSRLAVPAICAIRRLPTQRLRACVPNGTFRIQSQLCAGD